MLRPKWQFVAVLAAVVVAAIGYLTLSKERGGGGSHETATGTGTRPSEPILNKAVEETRTDGQQVDFASRWKTIEGITDPTRKGSLRGALLGEWLTADFGTAFAFLRSSKFEHVSLPGVAGLLAKHGSASDFVSIADEAALPLDALRAIGRFLEPTKLKELAEASDQIAPSRQADCAAAIAMTFAIHNLDAALAYAGSRSGTVIQASAYAAIADTLTSRQAATDALAMMESLPAAIRDSDPLRLATGNALRDTAPETALASYQEITDPQARRLALVSFSRSIESRAPGAALQAIFAAGLSSEGTMNHANRILRTWSAFDSEAAREFIAGSDLFSDGQRRQLQKVPALPRDP